MKTYEAYLFDWDGTLARTLEIWLEVMRSVFEEYGLESLSDDEIVASFGNVNNVALALGIPQSKMAQLHSRVHEMALVEVPYAEVYEGAIETINKLKNNGKKVALISTDHRSSIDIKLSHNSLEDFFDVVVSGDEVKSHKPDPEGINYVLSTLGVKPHDSVMIGDSPHDLGAARNAGIDSILFYPPSHQLFYELGTLRGENPTHIITNLREMLEEDA